MSHEETNTSLPEVDDIENTPSLGDIEAVFFDDAEEFYRTHGNLNPEELADIELDDLVHIHEALRHEKIETESRIERIQTEILKRQSRRFQRAQTSEQNEDEEDAKAVLTEEEFWELIEMLAPGEYVDFIAEETEHLPLEILEWYRGFLLHTHRSYTADQFHLDEALQRAVRSKNRRKS